MTMRPRPARPLPRAALSLLLLAATQAGPAGLALAAAPALAAAVAAPVPAKPPAWPDAATRLVAADAAAFAPPDLKRQLVKHRDRLMKGASEGRLASASLPPDAARAEAVKRARAIAKGVPAHVPFWDVAYEAGALSAFAAAAFPPATAGAGGQAASKGTSFLGYPAAPFADPERTSALALPAATDREAYDAAVTLSTRLLAWAWKTAGGDASITSLYPEAKGPYRVRD